jgi:uncharacterized protein YbcC (UPF0753/DUF2309 family)
MKHLWKILIEKNRFQVYVNGEFERQTNFTGLLKLLADYADFFRYTDREQSDYLAIGIQKKSIYIDANITVKFK